MDNRPGVIYSPEDGPFVASFRMTSEENRATARRWHPVQIARIERLLDLFHEFIGAHFRTFELTRPTPDACERLLFSVAHKNQIALLAILENILIGLHGAVRPLFRQVFEAQLLAKFVSSRSDLGLAEQWARGQQIAIGRSILRKLPDRLAEPIGRLYTITHKYVHATTSSQQVSLHAEDNAERTSHDLTVLGLLLHSQRHFLFRHAFSRATANCANRYARYANGLSLVAVRNETRALLAADLIEQGAEARAFIRSYRGNWAL